MLVFDGLYLLHTFCYVSASINTLPVCIKIEGYLQDSMEESCKRSETYLVNHIMWYICDLLLEVRRGQMNLCKILSYAVSKIQIVHMIDQAWYELL